MSTHEQPQVTVITPTYNRAGDYLEETIESVLAQDYPNFEYLVLDDGSTDNTRELVAQYDDPRLHYHYHDNMGEARTVNKGFQMASGAYIVIVNSDDPILPGLLSSAVETMKAHPAVLVAYPDWQMIDAEGQPLQTIATMSPYNYIEALSQCRCVPGPGAFIRREVIEQEKGRDPSFRYISDTEFWLRTGLRGPFIRIPQVLASHRIHTSQLTHVQAETKVHTERLTMLDKIFALPTTTPAAQKIKRKAYASAHYISATTALQDRRGAAYHMLRSIMRCPWRCRPAGQPRDWSLMLYIMISALLPGFLRRPLGKIKVRLMGS